MRPLLILLTLCPLVAHATDYMQPFSFFHLLTPKKTDIKQRRANLDAQITSEPLLLKEEVPDISEKVGTVTNKALQADFEGPSDRTIMELQQALNTAKWLDSAVVDMGVEESGLLLFGNSAEARFNPFRQWVRRLLVYSPLCVQLTVAKPHHDLMFHQSIINLLALMRDVGFEDKQQKNMLLNVLQLSMEISKRPEYFKSVLDSLNWPEFRSLNYKVLNEAVENTGKGKLYRYYDDALRQRYQAVLLVEGVLRNDYTVFNDVRQEMNCSVLF